MTNTRLHPAVFSLAMLTLAILYVPLLAVAVFSVNASSYGLAWKGFTLDWYLRLFQNQAILESARNTLILATVSTLISTILGALLAIAMSRFPWSRRMQTGLDLVVYLPVVTPDIIFAAALVVAFALLRQVSAYFEPGLLNMVLAHVTFQIAFVALVVQSRLATMGRVLEEAARDLYASSWYLFRRITLPLLMPGIVAGAMLAFTLSLDDFIISFFTAGPDSTTFPIHIYNQVGRRRDLNPQIHALSTLLLLLTVLLVLGLERMTRKGRQ